MVVSDPTQGRVIGQAYSANGCDGTIGVVAESADGRFETIATVPTAQGGRTIAAESNAHLLFSPTAHFKPQPASGAANSARPEAIAGTFRILPMKDTEAR